MIAKISQVAGIDLVPSIDFEIANINISINDQTIPLTQNEDRPLRDDDLPAVAWHYDSFPFVCVTMLSDCTGMVGGETPIKKPNGEIMKVRGPAEVCVRTQLLYRFHVVPNELQQGTAVILQGRYIEHQALKALGGRERISMVTCFRPKSPFVKDETVLVGVRPISDLSELYTQYTEYRLEILEERIRAKLKSERQRKVAQRPFNISDMRKFLQEQKEFLESMLEEIIELD